VEILGSIQTIMNRVILGRTGLSVSPVAFGTWQLSPRFWGDQPKDELIGAMKRAVDAGINFFDTADAYGDGYGETVLGEALKTLPRKNLVIATKWFNHFNPDKTRYPDLSRAHLIERAEASLKRLGVEAVDIAFLHFHDPLTPPDETAAALETLKKQGKVFHFGVSNHTVEQTRAARSFAPYDVVQPPYSLIDPAGENDLLPYCQAENLGIMIYSPLHKGLLTGKYKGTETFDDFRKNHPDFQGERFQSLCQRVQSLKPMAETYGLSIYQLILAATLMHPAIHVAICGTKTAEQIAEAAGVMGKTIDRKDVFAIRSAVRPGAVKVMDSKGPPG
jgi:aryl-alcohol dehydrogenase-like predicted oxidoreductase